MKYFFIISCLLLVSCTKTKNTNKDTLNYAISSNISTLDPAISYDTVSAKVIYQMYESLYEYDYLLRPYQLKPLLAKELPRIENNGLTYTIKIKENIYYHSIDLFKQKPRKVIAEDFINQIKRLAYKPTKSSGWWLFDGKILGLNKFRNEVKNDLTNFFSYQVEGLKALDDHTLQIKLTQPYPQLIYALAMAFTTPIPKEMITKYKNDLTQIAIGTGPYQLVEWKKSSLLKLKKNKNYHTNSYPKKGDRFSYENNLLKDSGKTLPFIENINFHIMKEAQTRWLKFRNKEIDLIVLTKDHFPIAINNAGKLSKELKQEKIQLQVAPTLTYWWLAFNMTDPILGSNKYLRKAIAHAINIDEYIKNFTNNIALKANSIYPPGVTGYSPSNQLPYKYDVDLAKKLLAKAGYPNGKGLPEFSYDVRGRSYNRFQTNGRIYKKRVL